MEVSQLKILFGVTAGVIYIIGAIPYYVDIYKRQSQPHIYTWLIWFLTQGAALIILLQNKGGSGAIGLIIGVTIVFSILIFSLFHGTKDITRVDTITLIIALISIFIWLGLDNALLAILLLSFIDAIGYIPTFRKSYKEPCSEMIVFWLLAFIGGIFGILAIEEYNIYTSTYLVTITIMNGALSLMLYLLQRRS